MSENEPPWVDLESQSGADPPLELDLPPPQPQQAGPPPQQAGPPAQQQGAEPQQPASPAAADPHSGLVACVAHGLHYDPKVADGCVMCRSKAGKAASAGAVAAGIRERLGDLRRLPLGIVILVVVVLGLVGNYLLDEYRARQLDVKDIDLGSALARIDKGAGKVVLFHVWMPSCEICRGELPAYNQVHDDFGREDVELLMLAIDDSEDSLRDFLVDEDLDFPALRLLPTTIEDTRELFQEAGLSFKRVVPYTAVFGPDGELAEEWTGVRTAEYYANLIRSLE